MVIGLSSVSTPSDGDSDTVSGSFRHDNALASNNDLDWFNDGGRNNGTIDSLPNRDHSGLRVDCPKGENLGTQLIYRFDQGEPGHELDEAWGRYNVYFDPWDMTGTWEKEGKLPGFCNISRCGMGGNMCTGGEGFSSRMGFGDGPTTDEVQLSSYVYYANEKRGHYDWTMNGNVGAVAKGQWNQIDQHVKLNTPGEPDGLIEGWVNGTKAFERNFMFRTSGANWGIREWFHNVWWSGGSSDASPADNVVYFHDLSLSDGPLG